MNMLVMTKHCIGLVFCHSPMSKTLSSLNRCFAPVFLCPWKGGMSQGARDGGVTIPWKGGMSQGARDGGVTIAIHGRAGRYLLLGNCSCVALLCYIQVTMQYLHFHHPWWSYVTRRQGWRCQDRSIFLSFRTDSIRTHIYI